MEPRFNHDCEGCRFIATVRLGDWLYDWYVHEGPGGAHGAMVARYGDEPSENITPHWSMPKTEYWQTDVTPTASALDAQALVAHALRLLYPKTTA